MTSAQAFVNKMLEADRPGAPSDPDEVDPQYYIDKVGDLMSSPMDDFTRGYVDAMLWSTTDDNDEPLEKNYSYSNLAPAFLMRIKRDCAKFQSENSEDLAHSVSPKPGEWTAMEQAGHDFWLTRNGHGVGFWDRPECYGGQDIADRLSDAAHKFGEVHVYTVLPDWSKDQEDMELHSMPESVPPDFDPENYIDQLDPAVVATVREEQELRKRGFVFNPQRPELNWRLAVRDHTWHMNYEWVFIPPALRNGKYVWRLLTYTPNNCPMYRGTFDQMLTKFDELRQHVGEAIDPDNPEAALTDAQPFLVKGERMYDMGIDEIWYANRTSDGQSVGTIYRDNNRYGLWGWNDFYPEYFGREPKDFQQHNHPTAEAALAAGAQWLQQKGTLRPGGPSAAIESIVTEDDDPLDNIDPQHYLDWVGKKIDLGGLYDLHFGGAIGTSNEGTITDNAQEHGLVLTPAIWERINCDIRQIEINVLRLLRKWFLVNDEGHGDDDLVCSMWLSRAPDPVTQREAVKLLKSLADNNEPVSTSKGDWQSYFGKGSYEALWKDVSNYSQSLVDVYFDLIDREKVVEWFDVNPYTESLDIDPEAYLDKLTPSYCRACMADLTKPNSVQRRYEEADPDPSATEIKTVDILGHYDKYHHFDPDEDKPGAFVSDFSYRDFTYHDDSDTCVACGSTRVSESLDPDDEQEVERYLDSFENLQDFQHDLTNYGFGQCNRIDVWGRWVILAGTTYWAEIEGRPTTEEDFRRLCAEFCQKHHVYDYKLKLTADDMAPAFGNPNRWFWFQLALPKAVFTDESLLWAKNASANTLDANPHYPHQSFPFVAGPDPNPEPPNPNAEPMGGPYVESLDLDDPDEFMAQHTKNFGEAMVEAGYIPTTSPNGMSCYGKPFTVEGNDDVRVFVLARNGRAIMGEVVVFHAAYGGTLGEGGNAVSTGHYARFKIGWLHIALAEIEKLAKTVRHRDHPEYYAKEIIFNLNNKAGQLSDADDKRKMVRDGARRNNLLLPETLDVDDPDAFLEQDWRTTLREAGFEFVNENNAKLTIQCNDPHQNLLTLWATAYIPATYEPPVEPRINFSAHWGNEGKYQMSLNYSARVRVRWLNIVLGQIASTLPELAKVNAATGAQKFIDQMQNILRWLNDNNKVRQKQQEGVEPRYFVTTVPSDRSPKAYWMGRSPVPTRHAPWSNDVLDAPMFTLEEAKQEATYLIELLTSRSDQEYAEKRITLEQA